MKRNAFHPRQERGTQAEGIVIKTAPPNAARAVIVRSEGEVGVEVVEGLVAVLVDVVETVVLLGVGVGSAILMPALFFLSLLDSSYPSY